MDDEEQIENLPHLFCNPFLQRIQSNFIAVTVIALEIGAYCYIAH